MTTIAQAAQCEAAQCEVDYNAGVHAGRGGGGLRCGATYEFVRGYWDGLREVREAAASAAAEVGACSQSRA